MAAYVPQAVRYNPVPFAEPPLSKRTVRITSPGTYNGTASSTFQFNIGSTSAFLDPTSSYFTFDVTATATHTADAGNNGHTFSIIMDGHGASWLKTYRTFVDGSADIDRIVEYHKFYNAMYDLEAGDVMGTSHAVAYGTPAETVGSLTPYTAKTGAQEAGEALKALGCPRISTAQTAATTETTGTTTVVVRPLGLLATAQYIPLFALGGSLNVEFTLEEMARAFLYVDVTDGSEPTGASFTSYTITNATYHAVMLTYSGDMINNYLNILRSGNSLEIHYNTFLHTSDTLVSAGAATAKLVNAQIHAKSLKSMFMLMRDRAMATTAADVYSNPYLSQRVVAGITNVQLIIGDMVYPQTPMTITSTNYSLAFCELLKALGRLGDVRAGSRIRPSSWVSGTATDGNHNAGAITTQRECLFFIGFDVESFNSAEADGFICGVNTEDQHARMVFSCNLTPGAVTNLEFDVYGMVDGILRIGASGASVWI